MKLALIGGKLSHSYSAVIHDLFFRLTGIAGTYELVEVPDKNSVGVKLDKFDDEGYTGINVTIPHKIKVLEYVDSISREVEKLGAANTIHFTEKGRIAYNTDYYGFKRTLDINGVDPNGKKWLVLGYGGGAKSVIEVLRDGGASIVTVASTSREGRGFIEYSGIKALEDYEGVVNTTPLGMYPAVEGCPVSLKDLKNFKTAIDIVYNPLRTLFLKRAGKLGLKTVRGLYMLVAQAVKAQEIWNGREFGDEIIDEIYRKVGKTL